MTKFKPARTAFSRLWCASHHLGPRALGWSCSCLIVIERLSNEKSVKAVNQLIHRDVPTKAHPRYEQLLCCTTKCIGHWNLMESSQPRRRKEGYPMTGIRMAPTLVSGRAPSAESGVVLTDSCRKSASSPARRAYFSPMIPYHQTYRPHPSRSICRFQLHERRLPLFSQTSCSASDAQ